MRNRNFVITISHEYGSNGRIIGQAVAKMLGFDFYNHNIIDMIAYEQGLARKYIEHGERGSSRSDIWEKLFSRHNSAYTESACNSKYYYNRGKMFSVQSKIIQEAAEKNSCVIVGRCADYILRKHTPSLHILIHTDKKNRIQRIKEEYKDQDARKTLEIIDRERKNYYRQSTGCEWGNYENYDLVLDSGTFDINGCVEIIIAAVTRRK